MLVSVACLGEWRTLRFPKIVLEQCGIDGQAEMRIYGTQITLKAFGRRPRAGWEAKYRLMKARHPERLAIHGFLDLESAAWEW